MTLNVRTLLIMLTVVTGIVDAVSYLGLGHVFVANMTGNVVFLGFSLAGAPGLSALASITAILAFLLGALLGGRLGALAGERSEWLLTRSSAIQTLLVALATVLAALAVHAEVLIIVLSVAMGLQNAAVRKIGLPDLTTTVLTMTLTGFAADSKAAGGPGGKPIRKLTAVGAMLIGAACGAVLQLNLGMWPPLLLASGLLAAVTVVAFRLLRRQVS